MLDGDKRFVVGRGREADVTVPGGQLSRRHVVLERGPDGWVATDASANGVWRDGQRVKTVSIGAAEVTLRLGAVDGPEIKLLVVRPEPPARPAQAPSPATVLGEAETVRAPGAAPGAPPPQVPTPRRAPKSAPAPAPPVRQSEPYGSPVPAGARASVPAQRTPEEPAPSAVLRWLRLVPTLIWLLGTGFALGALLALS
jgi:hypothetical protein